MQPVLDAGAAVRADGVLAEVEPVLDGAPVPAPLPRPVQAHVLAPAAHLPQQGRFSEGAQNLCCCLCAVSVSQYEGLIGRASLPWVCFQAEQGPVGSFRVLSSCPRDVR